MRDVHTGQEQSHLVFSHQQMTPVSCLAADGNKHSGTAAVHVSLVMSGRPCALLTAPRVPPLPFETPERRLHNMPGCPARQPQPFMWHSSRILHCCSGYSLEGRGTAGVMHGQNGKQKALHAAFVGSASQDTRVHRCPRLKHGLHMATGSQRLKHWKVAPMESGKVPVCWE